VAARELGASLESLPAEATLVIHCDIEPIVKVRQVLEAAGWEVTEREFSPAERAFRVTSRKRG